MRTILLVALLVAVPLIAIAPAAQADDAKLPPEYIGGSCGGFHWHEGDVKSGELPRYHYHHCI